MCDSQNQTHRCCVFQHRTFKHVAALRSYFSSKHGKQKVRRPTKPPKPPCLAPRRPRTAGFHPRWGKQPVPVRSGAIWAPQGPVWQKEKKPPTTPVGGEFGGVKKKQVKGPGSLEASRAGSLRPAEPVVEGFFTGVNFPVFRSRFWGLGVTDGVRKQEFPGGKPFLRVSPPGSTKG